MHVHKVDERGKTSFVSTEVCMCVCVCILVRRCIFMGLIVWGGGLTHFVGHCENVLWLNMAMLSVDSVYDFYLLWSLGMVLRKWLEDGEGKSCAWHLLL